MFPSKSDGMFVPESLIFRSDSNGEDLEGYAGAGLYDSITMDKTKLQKVDYNGDRYETVLLLLQNLFSIVTASLICLWPGPLACCSVWHNISVHLLFKTEYS